MDCGLQQTASLLRIWIRIRNQRRDDLGKSAETLSGSQRKWTPCSVAHYHISTSSIRHGCVHRHTHTHIKSQCVTRTTYQTNTNHSSTGGSKGLMGGWRGLQSYAAWLQMSYLQNEIYVPFPQTLMYAHTHTYAIVVSFETAALTVS